MIHRLNSVLDATRRSAPSMQSEVSTPVTGAGHAWSDHSGEQEEKETEWDRVNLRLAAVEAELREFKRNFSAVIAELDARVETAERGYPGPHLGWPDDASPRAQASARNGFHGEAVDKAMRDLDVRVRQLGEEQRRAHDQVMMDLDAAGVAQRSNSVLLLKLQAEIGMVGEEQRQVRGELLPDLEARISQRCGSQLSGELHAEIWKVSEEQRRIREEVLADLDVKVAQRCGAVRLGELQAEIWKVGEEQRRLREDAIPDIEARVAQRCVSELMEEVQAEVKKEVKKAGEEQMQGVAESLEGLEAKVRRLGEEHHERAESVVSLAVSHAPPSGDWQDAPTPGQSGNSDRLRNKMNELLFRDLAERVASVEYRLDVMTEDPLGAQPDAR